MASFTGKTALITGSASGLGKAVAEAFLNAGAQVVLCDINEARLTEADTELSKKGAVFAHQVDVTSEESITALFKAAVTRFGKLDILVNNAGIMDSFVPAGEIEKAQWDRVLAVNLTGPLLVTKHFVSQILAQQPTSPASIVNVGSIASFVGWAAGPAYTTTKHALVGLTKNTAAYYRSKNIRCNLIQPPAMRTNLFEMVGTRHEEGFNLLNELHPKCLQPENAVSTEEVAKLVLYLSSEQAGLITGQCISPDRGIFSAS